MLRVIAPLGLALLAACTGPSPHFAGVTPQVVTARGMGFHVYRRADEVEAYRTGGGIPRQSAVFLGAISAIEKATGCPVRPRSVIGDQAVVSAEIDCAP